MTICDHRRLHRKKVFQPQCTHITMTRMHDPHSLCSVCHCSGPLGWVYVCTQDCERLIKEAAMTNRMDPFDEIGRTLLKRISPRNNRAGLRDQMPSSINDCTPRSAPQYSSNQQATISRQREQVRNALEMAQAHGHRDSSGSLILTISDLDSEIARPSHGVASCNYRVCPRCRPTASERTLLSLNAVANDDILPTAAIGYGFQALKERPVADAKIWQYSLHCPNSTACLKRRTLDYSFSTGNALQKLLETQILRGCKGLSNYGENPLPDDQPDGENLVLTSHGHDSGALSLLKRSPRCRNLAVIATDPPELLQSPSFSDGRRSWADDIGNMLGETRIPDAECSEWPSLEMYAEARRCASPSPLKIRRGVAIMEESIQLGVPDVITQA